ncbi:MAG: hypothetical protein V4568_00145 [Pseudomonadota bacterium]
MPLKQQSTSSVEDSTQLDLLNRYTSYGVRAHALNDETINKLAETFKDEFPEAFGREKIKTNFRATDLPFLLKHFLSKLINGEESIIRTDPAPIVQLQSEFSTSYDDLPVDIRQLECITKTDDGNTQITFLAIKQFRGEGWDRFINLLPFSNEVKSSIDQSIPPGAELALPSDEERKEALLNNTDDKRIRLQALLLGKNYWFGRQDFTQWNIRGEKIYYPDPRNPKKQIEVSLQAQNNPQDRNSEWALFGRPYIEEKGDGPFVTKTSKANIDSMSTLVDALPIYRFLQGFKVSGFDGLRSLCALAAHECNMPRNLMMKKNKQQIQVRDIDLGTGECKQMPGLPDEVKVLFQQLRKKHQQLGMPLGSGFFDYGDIPAVENAIEAAWNRLNKLSDESFTGRRGVAKKFMLYRRRCETNSAPTRRSRMVAMATSPHNRHRRQKNEAWVEMEKGK